MAGFNRIKLAKRKDQSDMKLERLKLSEIYEIITDKRFKIRFKIANLICRDYLRNYLATANLRLTDCVNVLESDTYSDKAKLKHIDRNIRRAKRSLEDVFDF